MIWELENFFSGHPPGRGRRTLRGYRRRLADNPVVGWRGCGSGPTNDLQMSAGIFDKGRAAFNPVSVIEVEDRSDSADLGMVNMAAQNPIYTFGQGRPGHDLFIAGDIFDGVLHGLLEISRERPIGPSEPFAQRVQPVVQGAAGLVDVETAALLCEWNDVDAALVRLKRGLDYLPWWGKADDFCLAYITLARIQLARGNRTEAAGAIEKAAQLVQTCGVFSEARSVVEAAQVKSWLAQGDWPAVDRWAAALEKRLGAHDPFRFEDELTHITQARVFIAQNKLDEAIRLLSCLEECARSGGRQGRLIEIMVLKALAMQKLGEPAQASAILEQSLALAEPEGYMRVFLDEAGVQELLSRYIRAPSASHSPYALKLLQAFPVIAPPSRVIPSSVPQGDLIEPLTPREQEVLQLICAGESNQRIADKLVITVSGVKKHIGNILGKLGVTNRGQAIVKAHEMGLFPKIP